MSASHFNHIDKINKLLAMAGNEALVEEVRANYLAKAERLRAAHMIDEALLRQAGTATQDNIIEEGMEVEYLPEFWEHLDGLIAALSRHCSLRSIWRYKGGHRQYQMTGFRSDIEFFGALWTSAYMEFTRSLLPQWDTAETFDSNVYRFVKAGYRWADIHAAARAADDTVAERLTPRFRTAYVREATRRGEEPGSHTQRHGAFRNSYAQAYTSTIRHRLYAMRDAAMEDHDRGDGYSLALSDTKTRVDAEFYRRYPQYDPKNMKFDDTWQKQEDARRAAMTPEERDAEDARKEAEYQRSRKAYDRLRSKMYDSAGWEHGSKVAKNVDLSGGKNHVANRTEIDQ